MHTTRWMRTTLHNNTVLLLPLLPGCHWSSFTFLIHERALIIIESFANHFDTTQLWVCEFRLPCQTPGGVAWWWLINTYLNWAHRMRLNWKNIKINEQIECNANETISHEQYEWFNFIEINTLLSSVVRLHYDRTLTKNPIIKNWKRRPLLEMQTIWIHSVRRTQSMLGSSLWFSLV